MKIRKLSDTLIDLAGAFIDTANHGLEVTEASLKIPLEVKMSVQDGKLSFCAAPPHSRWKTGVLPEVHMAHILIKSVNEVENSV